MSDASHNMRNIDQFNSLIKELKSLKPDQLRKYAQGPGNMESLANLMTETGLKPYEMSVLDKIGDGYAPVHDGHRMLVEWFKNSSHDAVDYLQRNHPELKFGIYNNQIYAKPTEANEDAPWQPVAPAFADTMENAIKHGSDLWSHPNPESAKKLYADINEMGLKTADQIPKVTQGAAQGLAGTIGTASGLALGAPAGAAGMMPLAYGFNAAAQGGAASLHEALRQKLGQALGVNKDTDYDKVMDEGMSAAKWSPLFTNMGRTAEPFLSNNVQNVMRGEFQAANKLTPAMMETVPNSEVLDWAGKKLKYGGAFPAAASAVGDAVKGGIKTMTGATDNVVDYVMKNGGLFASPKKAFVSTPEAVSLDVARPLRDQVDKHISNEVQAAKGALDSAESGMQVPIKSVQDAIMDHAINVDNHMQMVRNSPLKRNTYNRGVNNALNDIMDITQSAGPEGTLDADTYRFWVNEMNHDLPKGNLLMDWSPPKSRAAEVSQTGSMAAKKALKQAAYDTTPGLEAANNQWGKAQDNMTYLNKALVDGGHPDDFSKVFSSIQDRKSPTWAAIDKWASETMSPEEYAKFTRQAEALRANQAYHGIEGNAYVPMGTMHNIGGEGATAIQTISRQGLFNKVMPVYGTGSKAATLVQNAGSYVVNPLRQNYMSDPLTDITQAQDEYAKNQANVKKIIEGTYDPNAVQTPVQPTDNRTTAQKAMDLIKALGASK